jgi:hypothetical protein
MSFIADIITIVAGLLAILGIGALTNPTKLPQWLKDRMLVNAASSQSPTIVSYMLSIGADPNSVTKHEYKFSALHYASFNKNIPIMEMLLRYGANVESKCSGGFTPLYYATSSDQGGKSKESLPVQIRSAASLLLKYGAKVTDRIRIRAEMVDKDSVLAHMFELHKNNAGKTAKEVREETINYFVDQYREMIEENIDDYINIYKKYLNSIEENT